MTSNDPNEKYGPGDNNENKFINHAKEVSYTIAFENLASATAPAAYIEIRDTINKTVFDISSLRLGVFSWGDSSIINEPNEQNVSILKNLRPVHPNFLRIDVLTDTASGIVTWKFWTLDTVTLQLTSDPAQGFLPPNLDGIVGSGYVSYSIKPKSTIANGTVLANKATIIFDENLPITTPVWEYQIDTTKPQSQVNSLPVYQSAPSFLVSWTGTDAHSGIDKYSVYVSVDDSLFKVWKSLTTATSDTFHGQYDHTYKFFSIGVDKAGNFEDLPPDALNNPDAFSMVVPVNDEAPGAILLTSGSGCSGSPFNNSRATQGTGEPYAASKGSAGYKTVWYKFMAPASGNVRVSTDYSGGTMGSDSRLALFSATDVNNYSTFTSLASDDDNGVIVPDRSILYATGLTPGNTYYIQVDGKDGSTSKGTFCLTVDELTSDMLSASTGCSSGQALTSVNDNYTGWLSATDASGKLIALISNPTGGTTNSTYINTININSGPVRTDPVSLQNYLDRNYLINNDNLANTNIHVQLFFLNTELAALQAADPSVTLANLQATRQTGAVCDNDFIAANGTNSSLVQTSNGTGTGFSWIQVQTPGFSKFYLHTKRAYVPLRTFLQGAYSTGLSRHKDVSSTWAAVLNANALNQPYNVSPFSYSGTESVSAGFFTSTAATTDITDWVLVEIRNAVTPSSLVTRKAAFIREDGLIKDLNGTSDLSFRTVANGNYHVVIRHRNHLPIRTASVMTLDGTLGYAPLLKNFSAAQATSFQDPAVTSNAAQKDFAGGVFGMWGGNGNSNNTVRATGVLSINDYLHLITTTLGSNVSAILSPVYSNGDLNLDGQARATGVLNINDYLFLITTVLGSDASKIINQHQ